MKKLHVILALLLGLALTVGFYVLFGWVIHLGLAAFGIGFSLYQCVWIGVFCSLLAGLLSSIFGGRR